MPSRPKPNRPSYAPHESTARIAHPPADAETSPSRHTASGGADRLPMAALIGLALTGFLCIMTETMPAGLLPQMAADLHLTLSLAGQTVTAYAMGSVLAAIPLTIATRRWPRRRVLLLTLLGFLLCNAATAYLVNVPLILLARFGAGAAAGLAWSLLAGYARRMVAPPQQGRALAVAMAGTPVALSVGVPLGTWLGDMMG